MSDESSRPSVGSPDLAKLIRACRERLDPTQVPGLLRGSQNRETGRVSQETMARLIGVTSRWYGAFERGQEANYSDEFLQRAAEALRMNDGERKLMFYLLGHEPPVMREMKGAVAPSLLSMFEQMPWPVYVSDEAWNVVAHNSLFDDWFPWIAYVTNVMEYIFTFPVAQQQLVDWERDWAAPMLSQVRLAHTHYPDNEKLDVLVKTLFDRSAYVRSHWNSLEMYEHPDGDHRVLYTPGRTEPTRVEIVAMAPLRSPQSRVIYLIPEIHPGE